MFVHGRDIAVGRGDSELSPARPRTEPVKSALNQPGRAPGAAQSPAAGRSLGQL